MVATHVAVTTWNSQNDQAGQICEAILTDETPNELKEGLLDGSDEELLGVYPVNLSGNDTEGNLEDIFSGLLQMGEAFDKPEIGDLLAKFFEVGFRAGIVEGEERVRKQMLLHLDGLLQTPKL